MILAINLGLTYYSFTTKTDVTILGSVLFMLSMELMLLGILSMYIYN